MNPELDQVIADGLTTVDTAARVELYNEFQRIIADDLPNISLVDFMFTPAHRDQVRTSATTRAGRCPTGRTSGSPPSDLSAPARLRRARPHRRQHRGPVMRHRVTGP